MGNVYSSSYGNICATAAADGTQGLFFDRQSSGLRVVQLSMRQSQDPFQKPESCFAHTSGFFTKQKALTECR
jgi:hypothetical protein